MPARRRIEVTYRVRVDIVGIEPPIWRRLEVTSGMLLDELHRVLQAGFGWTDGHLHMFASGTSVWDEGARRYLCPFDVEEGTYPDGVPEQDVRLDEVLAEVGDLLHYAYDYGDGWEHVVRLEAIVDRSPDQARARYVDGRRAGPPEDCGGIPGYEELVASGAVGAEEIDPADVNARLSTSAEIPMPRRPSIGTAGALLDRVRGHRVELELAQLVTEARLDAAVLIDSDQASIMASRHLWLLERVGAKGIRLTSAGYLPPSDVVAAWAELDLGERWYGKGNREVNTLPLLLLRESAQRIGLLRKHRGTLLLTKKGQRLRMDAGALWWHVASHLLPRDPESFEAHASLISLLGVAGAREIDSTAFKALRTDALEAIGWVLADGGPLDEWLGTEGAAGAVGMLRDMGAFAAERPQGSRRTPTSGGRALARAALRDAGSNDSP